MPITKTEKTTTNTSEFATHIAKGCHLLNKLKSALEEERSALERRDLEGLKKSTQDKQSILLSINSNIKDRNDFLTLVGYSPSESGLNSFLASLPEKEMLHYKEQWSQLNLLLIDVRETSHRNEQILKRSKHNVEHLLAILKGHTQKHILYDPEGGKGNYSAQRRIGKA